LKSRKTMAGHFLLTPSARNFTIRDVAKMSNAKVHSIFVRLRWGSDNPVCPKCGECKRAHRYLPSRRQWRCGDVGCQHNFSVTSGTKFADHKISLKTILMAMVLYANHVKGISASEMSRTLGVAYMTAFVLLHKLRESMVENADKEPLAGLIHIDGAHVSGRVRKPRVKLKTTQTPARAKTDSGANPDHPNRRIVMVLREVDPDGVIGATRTIVEVVPVESQEWANKLAKDFIKKGAKVMTDEHPAYGQYMARYDHATVNHSFEFSTDAGVNNNQAESFFARMRRMVWGQIHRLTPKYMYDYTTEVAWREDARRTPTSVQVEQILGMALKRPSTWWRGYWQGHHRDQEILFMGSQ